MRMKKPLSLAISMAALGSNALVVPNLALAQADDKEMIEEITVTGSRIKRADFESISPVTTVDSERFSLAGPLGTEQLLNQLPQVLPGLTNTSNNPGDGTASVDLRGLGSKRTMVLVNGRRMVPTGQDGTVDINNIPSSLIEKVEVVTGGASAIYGSDAIAGH
ncbi:MAG: TonB-dependent receptor plug domain-containing protein [Exilibacterium sp.]